MNDITFELSRRSATRALFLPLLLALGLVFAGCGDDEGGGGGGGKQAKDNVVHFMTADESLSASTSVALANPLWFDEGGTLRVAVIGGWVDEAGDFGTVTARLVIYGERGAMIPTGAYALTDSDTRASETAKLTLESGDRVMTLVSGTLNLREIEGSADPSATEKITSLSLTFEGTFSERGQSEPQAIEGEIVFIRE